MSRCVERENDMHKMTGTVEKEPQPNNGRISFLLKEDNGCTRQCISGPGFACPSIQIEERVTLIGNTVREVIAGGESLFFSFAEVEYPAVELPRSSEG